MSSPATGQDGVQEPGVAPRSTFMEDASRNIMGQPPVLGPDGRPVEQKWATGAGRIVGFVGGVLGVLAAPFVGMLGVALGFLALVLGSTARGHMAPGRSGRWVASAAFVLGIVAIALGVVSFVIGIILR
ncbi:hypothetical protein J7E25_03905 [Agromyces sp. ISL-38]|uniref:hypothetical protein n=1 Tax=Agromyces sp. ISL-38 TaxID=2819107 RepID=UPI001BE6FBA2|nr:hypothetical protein [Agromyces sp. ISL-38]MBT2498230.1 hypothetical protein [Agromyces sp. ISL-38]MBT2518620.1 hypothetical protein [Streptomyces sp. ISL-90]